MKKKINLAPIFFIGAHIILFIVFILLSSGFCIYAYFTILDLVNESVLTCLDNYKTILYDSDSMFHDHFFNGMKNTFIFVGISVPLMIIISLLIALLLEHKEVKMKNFFQSII